MADSASQVGSVVYAVHYHYNIAFSIARNLDHNVCNSADSDVFNTDVHL